MAAAFVQSAVLNADASATTIAVTRTGVTAGNLILLWVKHEGATTTITASDGTTSLTQGPSGLVTHANGDLEGAVFYLPSSVASGSVTYTATFGATRSFRQIMMMEFSGSGTKSTDGNNEATGASTSIASGTITTTGTDVVVVGTYGNYSGGTTSSEQIGGVAAGGRVGTESSMWYRILTATMTSGQATGTKGGADPWISQILAVKFTAGISIPVLTSKRTMRGWFNNG
jgi:hypothetical protein